ncbi:MAG: hypothetical protein M1814_002576 [Vezdaea aestivalis]|nr:MAG: hypothetical protein M1814_002576 [Vezdaea aestivalis]
MQTCEKMPSFNHSLLTPVHPVMLPDGLKAGELSVIEDPKIYAELLSNIRRISIIVTLASPPDATTRVAVDRGTHLGVSHQSKKSAIQLPATVLEDGELEYRFISGELSLRLQLKDEYSSWDCGEVPNVVPWMAGHLSSESELLCRNCSGSLLAPGAVKAWKDLPNENWAELMDFWHCHKPPELHSCTNTTDEKGHAASKQLAARMGIGLVERSFFLLAAEDCKGSIKVLLCPIS